MKVLIIEDEDAAARRLQKLVKEIIPEAELEEPLDSVEAVLNWLDNNELPDLIFMDIHLADGSSFEIFNHVQVEKPVIFTTAYDQYAIQAFKVNTIDYLLKPIKRQELEQAIEKYRKWLGGAQIDYAQLARAMQGEQYNKRFLIRIGQSIRVVEMKEAAYFYTESKISFVVTREGKRYPLDYSLEKLEEMSDPQIFFRINRQFIVNIEAIKEMYAYSKSRVKVELVPPCELETIVSTERSPYFKKWLVGEEG
ncbi:MAG: response regulator transcription factor [Phaeodactylibacter sp.]|nr:response regulator transcription factor [Phaeodactylibacter sp.]MCB9050713.1 response regulator transcription factor [Lewinellaceae bacterium]